MPALSGHRVALVMICTMLPAGRLDAQGFSPEEAVRRMSVTEGFRVDLAASEPLVRQPVAIHPSAHSDAF